MNTVFNGIGIETKKKQTVKRVGLFDFKSFFFNDFNAPI